MIVAAESFLCPFINVLLSIGLTHVLLSIGLTHVLLSIGLTHVLLPIELIAAAISRCFA